MRYGIPNNMREDYIAKHLPFKSGRMRGIDGSVYHMGRLPNAWATIYRRDINNIAYTVMSYDTPIAWLRVNIGGTMTWFMPWVSYSSYSSAHQSHVMSVIRLKRYVSGDQYETVANIDRRYDTVHYGQANPRVFPHRRMLTGRTTRSIKNGDYIYFTGFGWCVVYHKFKSKNDGEWYVTTCKNGTTYYQNVTGINSFLRD